MKNNIRLKVGHMLALIVALAALAALPPLALYLRSSSETLEAARLEQQGLRSLSLGVELLRQVQQHRAVAMTSIAGRSPAGGQAAKAAEVTAALAALETELAGHPAELAGFSKEVVAVRRDWDALHPAVAARALTPAESFARHTKLAQATQGVVYEVADHFGLMLDPDRLGYNLVVISAVELPELAEALGRMRGRGNAILAAAAVTVDERAHVVSMFDRVEEKSATVVETVERIFDASPPVKSRLDAHARLAADAVAQAEALVRKEIIESPRITYPAADYVARMTRAIDAQFTLVGEIHRELASTLGDRIAELERGRLIALGSVALFAALAGLFAFVISRGIVRRLRESVAVAESIARGELDCTIAVRGRDEIADLTAAIAKSQQRLREVIGTIRESSEAVSIASQQIASGNADLSQRTEEQASSLEQTASSMEQLTATVRQNAENAKQANQLASSASDVAERGGSVVGEVVLTMNAISAASSKIADIIGVIDGIAFQTNILALNAAVEAARAGEQGRGFAVVATEVRSLAQRSAEAAKEIKGLIGDSVDKVRAGGELVAQAGRTMDEVVASVKRVTDLMAEITAASIEQSAGIDQVNTAITQMDQVTQQNAALVEEAAAAAESMQDQAKNLVSTVAVFKVAGAGSLAPAVIRRAAKAAQPANAGSAERTPAPRLRAPTKPLLSAKPAGKASRKVESAAGTDNDWSEF